MGYRNIVISSDVRLSCIQGQLVVDTGEKCKIPLEDINALLLESQRGNITLPCLSQLVNKGITVYTCDEKHMPSGVLFPFAQHSRQLGIIKLQDKLTVPGKKRLWQQIIRCKISNQALCLQYYGLKDEAEYLNKLADKVSSGDNEHVEAPAAAYYFHRLFGVGFSREDEGDPRNAALNYGYAILRGNVARLLAVYGFFPSYGIYHRSELNAFNLADDLLEPFRPVVDLFVANNISEDEVGLAVETKHQLFNLLNLEIESGKQKHSVAYATERLVQSLSKGMEDYQNNMLLLPTLLPLCQHNYE